MRILFVSSVSTLDGGAERSLLELARALRARGHEVSLAAWRAGELNSAFETVGKTFALGTAADLASPMGGATTSLPALGPLVRLLNWFRIGFRPTSGETAWLSSVISAANPDVIQTNCDRSPPAAARASDATGVPWVAHVRDHWRAWFHPRVSGALRCASAVIATSVFLGRRFEKHGIEPVVIPNPVDGVELRRDLTSEDRNRIRAEVGGSSATPAGSPFLVAVVGRLDQQKGALGAVEAAALLAHAEGPDIRFFLAGRGTEAFEARLRRAIATADVRDRVRLLGHRADVSRWLPALDALAVPSKGEPFGRMIVEGMHAGLPVVAYRDGAAPEIIEHDRTGVLVDPGDTAALADALRSLAGDPDRCRRLGEAARKAAGRYEPRLVAGQMEQLYQSLLEG